MNIKPGHNLPGPLLLKMKTLNTYIEQINDPVRQQMLNYLAVEIELDRNVFENFDLSNNCMYDGQYDLALFVCKNIMTEEKPYLCFYIV